MAVRATTLESLTPAQRAEAQRNRQTIIDGNDCRRRGGTWTGYQDPTAPGGMRNECEDLPLFGSASSGLDARKLILIGAVAVGAVLLALLMFRGSK